MKECKIVRKGKDVKKQTNTSVFTIYALILIFHSINKELSETEKNRYKEI